MHCIWTTCAAAYFESGESSSSKKPLPSSIQLEASPPADCAEFPPFDLPRSISCPAASLLIEDSIAPTRELRISHHGSAASTASRRAICASVCLCFKIWRTIPTTDPFRTQQWHHCPCFVRLQGWLYLIGSSSAFPAIKIRFCANFK